MAAYLVGLLLRGNAETRGNRKFHRGADFLKPRGMSYVPLIAPNTPIERVKASAEGLENTFLYVITVKGITGARKELPKELSSRLDEVRAAVKLPIAAGFGISSKEQADEICRHADGYIIGSALVKRFGAKE